MSEEGTTAAAPSAPAAPAAPAGDGGGPAAPATAPDAGPSGGPGNSDVSADAESVYDSESQSLVESDGSNDNGFDSDTGELRPEDDGAEAPETESETEADDGEAAETGEADDGDAIELDEVQEAVLDYLGLDVDDIEGWDAERLDALVDRVLDSLPDEDGSDRGEVDADDAFADDPIVEQFDAAIDEVADQLVENYGDEIKPVADLFRATARDASRTRQQLDVANQAIVQMSDLVASVGTMQAEMALEAGLSRLEKQYPSLSKPDARERAVERFWDKWETGQYLTKGSMYSGVNQALDEAVSALFKDTNTEASAAAQLVKTNQDRVASQPGRGNQRPSPKQPANEAERVEDVYDEEVQAMLAG